MGSYFFDSSALAKLYHAEAGTSVAGSIIESHGAPVRISRLTAIEIPSVFAIKVRTQFITRDDARILVRQFHEDIVSHRFLVTQVRGPEIRNGGCVAGAICFRPAPSCARCNSNRSCTRLEKPGLVDQFVAADKVLCEVAALEGLAVLAPEGGRPKQTQNDVPFGRPWSTASLCGSRSDRPPA